MYVTQGSLTFQLDDSQDVPVPIGRGLHIYGTNSLRWVELLMRINLEATPEVSLIFFLFRTGK